MKVKFIHEVETPVRGYDANWIMTGDVVELPKRLAKKAIRSGEYEATDEAVKTCIESVIEARRSPHDMVHRAGKDHWGVEGSDESYLSKQDALMVAADLLDQRGELEDTVIVGDFKKEADPSAEQADDFVAEDFVSKGEKANQWFVSFAEKPFRTKKEAIEYAQANMEDALASITATA